MLRAAVEFGPCLLGARKMPAETPALLKLAYFHSRCILRYNES